MRVRLDQLLVTRGMAMSRTRARAAILEGKIQVNGEVQLKPGFAVDPGADIRLIEPLMPFVSRGALKLQRALDTFNIKVKGQVALDVGASTGGFTQVLLVQGARLVYAVDVGTGQLHPSLRGDPRVVSLEGVHVREMDPGSLLPSPTLVVIDVSFISLKLVLPSIVRLVPLGADVIALVKPQFEVGPRGIGKGGIVKDPSLREQAVCDVIKEAERLGFRCAGHAESPITGGDGNQEFLLYLVIDGK